MTRKETALRYFNEQKNEFLVRANAGIETYRKGDGVLKIVLDGKPISDDATVEFRLKNHEFRFGANIFMLDEFENDEKNRIYREKFAEVFNLATVPFYWSDLEPEEGKPRFSVNSPRIYRRPAPDLCVEYCKEKGIEPKCHCLNYDSFVPKWVVNDTVENHKKKLEKRFAEIAERYANDIPSFEVTNETLQPAIPRFSKFFSEDDFLEWSYRTADRYFPLNRLIINDYNYWYPETFNDRHIYYMQIERLLNRGISHLDSIGLQFHSFFPLESEPDIAAVRYNPEKLYRIMDLYARFGIAEQITEMTIPAYSDSEEDEYVQAEIIKNVYTAFFSHPSMEAVIYWNLVDGYAAFAPLGDMTAGENTYYGGLLHFNMQEKPAYKVLRHLIREEWTTDTAVKVENGAARFRGFYGDYDVVIHTNGKTIPATFTLSKNRKNVSEISV